MPVKQRTAIVVLVGAVMVLLVVGWRAWDHGPRTVAVDNNIGYVLLWPLFAAFLVWGWLRFRALERQRPADTASRAKEHLSREVPAELLPTRPMRPHHADPALDAYNTYLAELNARELQQHLRAAGLDIGEPPSRRH
ncbi:transcriptional regulator [Nocardia transvalensis]|uniref:transcriptional regulator n=1 Tax=Nocardia transvalensis TaxID=37333 RepID=UPI001893D04D|nr:transcriptional regulator [Nocardia transvalensis]MBF6330945.1 transcriptional regulator [Nocardia transvalensis]